MSKVQFIFAIHNHQPVGNFDFVAEEAYQKSYLPFVKVLEKHPKITITLHYTGILYHFFEQRHPEFIDALKKLVAEDRVEILSGGFYEPVLAVLADDDKIGQIRMLTDYVRRTLGYGAGGMWLAERVWEPHLPKFIAAAGINHVGGGDFYFKMAGVHHDELDGYYVTQGQDGVLRIFPGSERPRDLIPLYPPEETNEHLASLRSTERNRLSVMADDGEKFSVCPETYHTVYEEGWLDRFFTLIEENHDWLETTTFSEYLKKEQPRGRVYLPAASYMEMGEWALPTRAMKEYDEALAKAKNSPEFGGLRPFIKGGFWRNFLAKYSESNHMHKRMMMVSRKAHEALDSRGDGKSAEKARMVDHLYQAQCNDAYWHGIFGGLYLPHLRSAVYEHLIQAEYLADKVLKGRGTRDGEREGKPKKAAGSWLVIEQGDFDRDGNEEVMMNSEFLNVFTDPAEGGRISELDWKPRSFNLMNTLTRRREVYHEKILQMVRDKAPEASGGAKTIHERVAVKEDGLQYHLLYDWYTRGSLLDHFLGSGVDLASFMRSEYYEAGDFVLGVFGGNWNKANGRSVFHLWRNVNVARPGGEREEELALAAALPVCNVQSTLTHLRAEELNTSFGPEFNFSLLAGDAHDRYYEIPGHILDKRNLASTGETNNVGQVAFTDEWLKLKLTLAFSQSAILWRAPVKTVCQSESDF